MPVSPQSGKAYCTITPSAAGSFPVQAAYSGDASFSGSQSPSITQLVLAPPSVRQVLASIRLVSSADPVHTGQRVRYTATVDPVPDGGRIWFFAGGSVNLPISGEGAATCQTSYVRAGSHMVQVVYTGDSRFAASTSTKFKQTVKAKQRKKKRHRH